VLRRAPLLASLLALLLGAAAAGQTLPPEGDPYRLFLFAAPDRRVAEVGAPVAFEVEGLAAPETDEAAEALVRAFGTLVLPPEAEALFEVAAAGDLVARRRAGTRVFELSRRFVLRPRRAGPLVLPPVSVLLPGVERVTSPQALYAYERRPGLEEAERAVVPVVTESRAGAERFQRIGSAFFVAEDAVVTAYHVVLDAEAVRLQLPDGRRLTTRRAWAVDPARDVAVLHVDPAAARRAGVRPLPLADRFDADLFGDAEGGVTLTAGWPEGVQQPTAGLRYPGLRFGPADLLRVTSNAVRPGDSGGPLLDGDGRVLGVVASGRSTRSADDALREDLCLATDPRRALAARLAEPSPRPLRRVLAEAARSAPHADVFGAATLLLSPGRLSPDPERQLLRLGDGARRAPDDAALQFVAGSVYQALGDADRAAAAYEAALADAEGYFPALYALGHVYFDRGDYDRAEALFERAHGATAYARLAALALAGVHTARLRYDEAAGALTEVLDHDPRFAPALYLLGYGLVARGRTAEAEAVAVRLDRIEPAWADGLRLHLRRAALRPSALSALPRAGVPAP
jgi:hypothetical protein